MSDPSGPHSYSQTVCRAGRGGFLDDQPRPSTHGAGPAPTNSLGRSRSCVSPQSLIQSDLILRGGKSRERNISARCTLSLTIGAGPGSQIFSRPPLLNPDTIWRRARKCVNPTDHGQKLMRFAFSYKWAFENGTRGNMGKANAKIEMRRVMRSKDR